MQKLRRGIPLLLLLSAITALAANASFARNEHSDRAAEPDDVKVCNLQIADLTVTARLYYGDNDEEEVPFETEIYLLPQSLVTIIKQEKFTPTGEDGNLLAADDDYLTAFARMTGAPSDDNSVAAFLIWERIRKKQRGVIMTDLSGRGSVQNLKAGDYYLFAVKQTEAEIIIWNFPVALYPGHNKIEITQDNADALIPLDDL